MTGLSYVCKFVKVGGWLDFTKSFLLTGPTKTDGIQLQISWYSRAFLIEISCAKFSFLCGQFN